MTNGCRDEEEALPSHTRVVSVIRRTRRRERLECCETRPTCTQSEQQLSNSIRLIRHLSATRPTLHSHFPLLCFARASFACSSSCLSSQQSYQPYCCSLPAVLSRCCIHSNVHPAMEVDACSLGQTACTMLAPDAASSTSSTLLIALTAVRPLHPQPDLPAPTSTTTASSDSNRFRIPTKQITSPMHLTAWKQSEAYADVVSFILHLNAAVRSQPSSTPHPRSPAISHRIV